jgi:hypothetical protein
METRPRAFRTGSRSCRRALETIASRAQSSLEHANPFSDEDRRKQKEKMKSAMTMIELCPEAVER